MNNDRTILLVDDHSVVREGYRAVLQKQPGLRVVAEAGDGDEAYRQFKATKPDLVIMDLTMPGVSGIEGIRHIRQWDPNARILVFTMHQNAAFALQAIRAGARGYVTKSISGEELADAIRRVRDDDAVFSPRLAGFVLDAFQGEIPEAEVDPELDRLTLREREVLRLIARGYQYKEIALRLSISHKTVEAHVSAVLRKLQLSNRHELSRWAVERRLVD